MLELRVPCPYCTAGIGAHCRTATGAKTTHSHTARIDAYETVLLVLEAHPGELVDDVLGALIAPEPTADTYGGGTYSTGTYGG